MIKHTQIRYELLPTPVRKDATKMEEGEVWRDAEGVLYLMTNNAITRRLLFFYPTNGNLLESSIPPNRVFFEPRTMEKVDIEIISTPAKGDKR